MNELDCMRVIEENLRAVDDESARVRVAAWISSKYLPVGVETERLSLGARARTALTAPDVSTTGEIPGVAKLSQNGEIQLTVRDLKARSANDAAVRLVHVVVWASARLANEKAVSSKSVIVPLLKKYRCYDGNTRGAIAKDKGLVRDGDSLSLDFHAEEFAKKIIGEICDSSIEGVWKPGAARRRSPKSFLGARMETT